MFRPLVLLLFVSLAASALGACSSDSSDSSPKGDDADRGSASPTAKAKGNASGKFGSVVYKITGNVEASGELPFQPAASIFSGGGWALTFGQENGQEIMAINLAPETMNLLFGDGKVTVIGVGSGTGRTCTFKVDQQDGGGARGSFECNNASGTGKSGALYADGIQVRGSFDARTK